ncbi:hypothetical protein Tco_0775250 [Tanacetum coccineum]
MTSIQASTLRISKKPKISIILPIKLFIDLTEDDDKTPSPTQQPPSPNAPMHLLKLHQLIIFTQLHAQLISFLLHISSLPNSPPPKVSHPLPTQDQQPVNITTTLSPRTLLDFAFNTPSPPQMPPQPVFGHPIPFHLLEVHRATCLYELMLLDAIGLGTSGGGPFVGVVYTVLAGRRADKGIEDSSSCLRNNQKHHLILQLVL